MLNPTIKFLRKLWIDRGYTKEQAQAIAERDYDKTYKLNDKIYHFGGWEDNFTKIRMIEGARQ